MLLLVVLLLIAASMTTMTETGKGFIATGRDYVIQKMAAAIMEFEGWYTGSRSYRNNNPGNLKYAGQLGATGQDDQGHAIFPSFDVGWAALIRQLELAFSGRSRVYSPTDSLYEFFGKYAEGNSVEYATFVAGKLGVPPESTLSTLQG